jgi:hypothetical protein
MAGHGICEKMKECGGLNTTARAVATVEAKGAAILEQQPFSLNG